MSKVIVIGGGPAGMMAAYAAAESGHAVTLLEQNEKLGKKLFITGKGRLSIIVRMSANLASAVPSINMELRKSPFTSYIIPLKNKVVIILSASPYISHGCPYP